jgi:triphosphoribosyl-dephospho-CoA synthase
VLADNRISSAFVAACDDELAALKPGNVHVYADGHGMTVAEFHASARAAAPAIGNAGAGVGQRILDATETTWRSAHCNTNLGIVLLCAPLAAAAEAVRDGGEPLTARTLSEATAGVLEELTVADAERAFRAIALANPGGLGTAKEQDVRSAPTVTLREAMALAARRDRIARQYVSGFRDLFGFALRHLSRSLAAGLARETATTGLYLAILGRWADSHLVRKFGDGVAQSVTREGHRYDTLFRHAPEEPALRNELFAWDRRLKADGLNPGTSADLTVATLFLQRLLAGPPP